MFKYYKISKVIFLVLVLSLVLLVSCKSSDDLPQSTDGYNVKQAGPSGGGSGGGGGGSTPTISQFGFDPENTGRSVFAGPQTNKAKWILKDAKTKCGYETTFNSPVIDSAGNVYAVADYGALIALRSDMGIMWKYEIKETYQRDNCGADNYEAKGGIFDYLVGFTPALGGDGTIYFGTSGKYLTSWNIYAVDYSGRLKWNHQLDGPIDSDIKISHNNKIYFTTALKLYALDKNGNKINTYPISAKSNTPAISKDGTVYVCSAEGLIALDENLNHKWTFGSAKNLRQCDPSVSPETGDVYFTVKSENKLYAVDSKGMLKWKASIFWAESAPSIGADGTIYIGTADLSTGQSLKGVCDPIAKGDGVLFAINPDGSEKWRYYVPPTIVEKAGQEGNVKDCYDNTRAIDSRSVIGNDGVIYFGTDAGIFIALNPDGTEKWIFGREAFRMDELDNSGVISDGTIYVIPRGGRAGGIYAINDAGSILNDGTNPKPDDQKPEGQNSCQVGNENGVKCPSAEQCSSKEWINGCCIGGSCTASTPATQYNQLCNVGNEQGVTCDSKEQCSSAEWINNCCIGGTCAASISQSQYNQPCNIGSEQGKTCDSKEKCSSNEFLQGCCIGGNCLIS